MHASQNKKQGAPEKRKLPRANTSESSPSNPGDLKLVCLLFFCNLSTTHQVKNFSRHTPRKGGKKGKEDGDWKIEKLKKTKTNLSRFLRSKVPIDETKSKDKNGKGVKSTNSVQFEVSDQRRGKISFPRNPCSAYSISDYTSPKKDCWKKKQWKEGGKRHNTLKKGEFFVQPPPKELRGERSAKFWNPLSNEPCLISFSL